MRRLRLLLAAAVLAVPLTACAANDPTAQVRDRVAAVTAAANARDADGLRGAVDDLLGLLDAQRRSGDLTPEEAARIAAAARQVQDAAALVDDEAIEAERREREEAEQRAREEAERQAREEAARQAERDAKEAEEAAKKAAEELKKAEEEARKAAEEAAEEDKGGKRDDKGGDDDDG